MKFHLGKPTLRNVLFGSVAVYSLLIAIVLGAYKIDAYTRQTSAQSAFLQGIDSEKHYLISLGDSLAKDSRLIQGVRTQNSYDVLAFLTEQTKSKVIAAAVTNKEGIIFSRTMTSLGRGDNAYVIGPLGRAISQTHKETFSIEQSGLDPSQLIISSVRYVKDGEEVLGALFTTEFMNDTFAVQFAKDYLPKGTAVLFYTPTYGVYGDSVADTATKKLFESYFSPGSEFIANGKSKALIKLPNGDYYAVINTAFTGLEHPPGGALLVVQVYRGITTVELIVGFSSLILFLILIAHFHYIRKNSFKKRNYILILGWIVGVGLITFSVDTIFGPQAVVPVEHGEKLYNSVLSFYPAVKTFDQTYPQSVAIQVNTGPEQINTVGLEIGYDPSVVTITDISDTNSMCTNIISKTIDSERGIITFSCIVTNPGFAGIGTVMTLNLQSRTSGVFSLRFLPDTQVLANDGLGTNVLRLATDGSYNAQDTSQDEAIRLYSPTHPNSEQWYSNRSVDFVWENMVNATSTPSYSYTFDTFPDATTTLEKTTQARKITLTAPSDGVYYFHLAQMVTNHLAPVTTYKVLIDTTPPSNLTIRSSGQSINSGDVVRLQLSASDEGSGLQKNYYMSINNGLLLPTQENVYMPFNSPGNNTITVRAYDAAGNYSEQHTFIQVMGSFFQRMTTELRASK